MSDAAGAYVYVVDHGDKVVRRGVATGDVTPQGIVVTRGLSGDERVVLRAGGFLNRGQGPPDRQSGKGRRRPEGHVVNFRSLSAWSIRNPVVPIVLFLGLTLTGIVSFMMMKVQDQPDIEFPMVIVSIATGRRPDRDREPDHPKIEASVRTIAGWTRSRQQRRKAAA
jgi:hypothetical protein